MFKSDRLFELKIAEIKGYEDISRADDCDVIVAKDSDNKEKLIENGFFHAPNKITYRREISQSLDEFMKSIRKNKRKKIKKSIRKCEQAGIMFVTLDKLNKDVFDKWFSVYKEMITSKKHGLMIASTDWFEKNADKRCGVFAIKEGNIIGGIVARRLDLNKDTLSISFSALKKEFALLGLSEVLNVKMMEFARELGLRYLNRGVDTNLYGYHLSTGVYLFKKSLGFKAEPNNRYGSCLIKINNFSKFDDIILFFSYGKQKLVGNVIVKDVKIDIGDFNADFLERLDVYAVEGNTLKKLS